MKVFSALFVLFALIALFHDASSIPHTEKDALLDLYWSLEGPHWKFATNWFDGDPCTNKWFGLECDETNSHITALLFTANGLRGTISESIGSLNELAAIDFNGNDISGTIPESIGNCRNLFAIGMTYNLLTGSIPESMGYLSQLAFLHLDFNSFNGEIPRSFAKLSGLQYLGLSNNNLTGTIPEGLLSLQKTQYIILNHNHLTGSIPAIPHTVSNLLVLGFGGNHLSGPIPSSLSRFTSLQELELFHNDLSGEIPAELGGLSDLIFLDAQVNSLSSSIPSLASCSSLVFLNVHDNKLTGNVPEFLKSKDDVMRVHLQNNPFSCPVPSWASFTGATCSAKNVVPVSLISSRNTFQEIGDGDDQKVEVDVYGMAKCPDFKKMVSTLVTVDQSIGDIVDLHLNFIGEKDLSMPTGAYTMHGQTEALGELYELCVKKMYPTHFVDFITCLNENQEEIPKNVPDCASRLSINLQELTKCAISDDAQSMLLDSLALSKAANAVWSPTLYIDGQFECLWDSVPCLTPTVESITKRVCEAYRGSKVPPAACNAS